MNKYLKIFLHRGLIFGGFGPIVVGIVYFILGQTLEGFSLGIPALASDIAGNRDLLAEGGGLLFHTGSVGDAAKKLCALAENDALYCRLQAQAAQIGSARTASHMCRAYERFYRALAREGAR